MRQVAGCQRRQSWVGLICFTIGVCLSICTAVNKADLTFGKCEYKEAMVDDDKAHANETAKPTLETPPEPAVHLPPSPSQAFAQGWRMGWLAGKFDNQ